MKKRKVLLGIIVIIIIYTMSFASKIKRKEGFIGIYPSFNVSLSSNDTHGTLYIVMGMSVGPFAIPIYILDRVSSAIYDTVLLPFDYYKLYKSTNGKQIKYYEDENRVEWVGRGKIIPLLTDKKEKEYTLKNGNYIGTYIEYYENQNIKEEVFYYEDGGIKNKKSYSKEGKIMFSETYNGEDKFLDKAEYCYNEENRLEKIIITEKDYLIEKYYDENEKLKRQLKQTVSLEKWEGIEETYYENGKLKGQYIMNEDGVTDIEYSENGDIIKKEVCKYKFN